MMGAKRRRKTTTLGYCSDLEVKFWRQDAVSRLESYLSAHTAEPTEDGKASIRVRHIMPTLAALRDADAQEWGEFDAPKDWQDTINRARKVVGWKQSAYPAPHDNQRAHSKSGE